MVMEVSRAMNAGAGPARRGALDDRTMRRLTVWMVGLLLVGIPVLTALYVSDQYRPTAPSMTDQTITAAEKAVRDNPNSVAVRFALARAYLDAGRNQDAVVQFDELLKVQPGNEAVRLGRASAHLALGNLEQAKADLEAIVAAAKGAEMAKVDPQLGAAYFGLGKIALQQGDAASARDYAIKALGTNRTDADALVLYGQALAQTGDDKLAVAAFRRAAALVPIDWSDPYEGMQKSYEKLADTAGAAYARAMVAFSQGRYDEAAEGLQAQAGGTYAVDALVGLGLLEEKQGRNAAAADAYRRALTIDPNNFLATTGLGRVNDATTGTN